MKKLKSFEIRQMWLDFFKSKHHKIEESASLIPKDDPTLLWTNAGVTPLKKYFDGTVVPENPRITNAQKCIRTNDIENVGITARHHTFFEMLGNFSIGDYFREDAIKFAYELLFSKDYFAFDKDKIYITYYTSDLTTKNCWLKEGVKEDHLIALDSNFWEIGEGPCGPDTEIFYDRGEKYDKRGKELIEKDIENDRFIEIYNIVLSQYNSKIGVKRENYLELPSKNIDTGCGLERLCCIFQGTKTNFETDLFMPIINEVEKISNIKYEYQTSFKVIADHVRTLVFALSDGATFSNEGRGYVIRRVLRRAMKYARTLNINKPFLYTLVNIVVNIMKGYYKNLVENQKLVTDLIYNEEVKFLDTLANGEKKLFDIIKQEGKITKENAFLLYDTYGFPIELTEEYANESKVKIDIDGFYKELEVQKNRARNARKDQKSMNVQNEEYLAFKDKSEFIGYNNLKNKAKIIKKFGNNVVLDKTCFYATSGGQIKDLGTIGGYNVIDVIKLPNEQHLHILNENDLKEGMIYDCIVDEKARFNTSNNHTSAHLLQKALQVILGKHVEQQGQYVNNEISRFDFNNYYPLKDEDVFKVEDYVNEYIKSKINQEEIITSLDEAKKIGAMALFSDKYKNVVRVIKFGESIELCGGTHAKNTKDLEKYAILSIESIGSGIYRITACTSNNTKERIDNYFKNVIDDINVINDKLKKLCIEAKENNINIEIKYIDYKSNLDGYRYVLFLKDKLKEASLYLHKKEEEYILEKKNIAFKNLDIYKKDIINNKLISKVNIDKAILKDICKTLLNNFKVDLVFLANTTAESITFVCATSTMYNANSIIKDLQAKFECFGGGKPDFIQGGTKNINNLNDIIDYIKKI